VQVGLVIGEVVISTLKCDSETNVCKEALYDPSKAAHTENHLQFSTLCVSSGRDNCCGCCQSVENHKDVNYVNAGIPVVLSAVGMIGSSLLPSISNNKIYACKQISKLSQLVCAVFAIWCFCSLSPVFGLLKRFLFVRNNHDHEPQEMAQQTFSHPASTTLFRSQGTTSNICRRMKPASTVFCPSRRVLSTVIFLSVLCTGCAGASSYIQTQPHSPVQQQMTANTMIIIIQDDCYATM
jgi:hypothetical protein